MSLRIDVDRECMLHIEFVALRIDGGRFVDLEVEIVEVCCAPSGRKMVHAVVVEVEHFLSMTSVGCSQRMRKIVEVQEN